MQFTEQTDIGLRLLVLLAAEAPSRLATLDMAERHGLSHAHVQKVVQALQAAGFVETFRGRGGGVQLAQPADSLRIGAVVQALEPHMGLVECLREGPDACRLTGGCALTHTLVRARRRMLEELDRTTIADVVVQSPAIDRLRRR